MTLAERVGLGAAAWFVFAALLNSTDRHWLATLTCLLFASAILLWAFGRSSDRAAAKAEREQRDLLARLESDMRNERTGGWVLNEEGFYVRRDERGGDLPGSPGDDQERGERGDQGAVR
ncbi:hypothetical protein KNU79_gp15 [Gordonia phage NadineRae]|uniref:Uncharacterized protein n=1 Tax=Gordonia phage NadineRae TaxID=2652882 RepID=A0A5P8DFM5_9CAUD|nr:hypothetical protein KNU79_gp15 [Gordonia phage NadineRae]QFP97775.1 hypothetical protein SEA_NADINERAE_15 [Gordonia phage NadineRae]